MESNEPKPKIQKSAPGFSEKKSVWVSYLMSISSTHDNYLIGIAALIIAGVFGAVEVIQWLNRPVIEALGIILFIGVVSGIGYRMVSKQKKQFENLAEEIMLNDNLDENMIRDKYKKLKE